MTANPMTEDERAIHALIATWMRATTEGDADAVLALIADDALFLLPGHDPITKSAFGDTQKAIADIRYDLDYEIREVEVSGTLAYARSYIQVTVEMAEGPPLRRAGHVLSVFRREGGRWLLARDSNQLTEI